MRKLIVALAASAILGAAASASELRYTYTGRDFTNVDVNGSSTPFTTSDFISLTFTSPDALEPNLSDAGFAGPITSWSLTLGPLSYSSLDPTSVLYSINFSTDSSGQITAWQFTTQTDVVAPNLEPPEYPPTPYEEEVASFNLPPTFGVADLIYIPSIYQDSYYAYNSGSPGTWTVTSVPESSTWAMMLAGFAVLGFAYHARRRRPKASARRRPRVQAAPRRGSIVKLSCGLLSVLLVALPASAHAVVIFPPPPPPPGALPPVQFYNTYIGVAGSGPYPLTAPGEAQVPAGAQGGTGHLIVNLQPSPDVYLDFDNTQAVGGLAGGGGQIDMTYSAMYYNAALPMNNQGNPVVNVALLAEDFVSEMGAGTVTVTLSVDGYTNQGTSFGYALFDRQCATSSNPSFAACGVATPNAPFPAIQPFQMTENTVYTVELQVYALGGWNQATGPGGATGDIDPIISIDPSSADAGGGLFFSAGVGNGAVPEPSTWVMMLAGFAALGFAYRAQRRAGVAH